MLKVTIQGEPYFNSLLKRKWTDTESEQQRDEVVDIKSHTAVAVESTALTNVEPVNYIKINTFNTEYIHF